jgi:AcrR family transcriptional regulator
VSKQRILEVAFQSFSTGCYRCVSLSEIAEKVGIKKPSIYAHFESKEKLFLEVLEIELKRVYDYINTVISDNKSLDTEHILHKFLTRSIDYIIENHFAGGFWSNLIFVRPFQLKSEITLQIDELKSYTQDLIMKLIIQGIHRGDIIDQCTNSIVYSYLCLLQGNLLMALNSELFSMNEVNMSWRFFWDGIRENKYLT